MLGSSWTPPRNQVDEWMELDHITTQLIKAVIKTVGVFFKNTISHWNRLKFKTLSSEKRLWIQLKFMFSGARN